MPTDYLLYVLTLPEGSRSEAGSRQRQNLSVQGILGQGSGVTNSLSSAPGEQQLSGVYAGEYAEKMAAELSELGQSQSIKGVPLVGRQSETPLDAYYSVETANVNPRSAQSRSVWGYTLKLREQGTRGTHRREVTTKQRELSHPFGTATDAPVGVPAAATEVRWLDPPTDATTTATPTTTRTAELADVALYDTQQAPYSDASLVYDIPYADEGPVDVRVWDTRGLGSKLDGDGVLQWQKVFSAAHEYPYSVGAEAIIDNGRVRLRADPTSDPGVAVETWDTGTSSWTTQALGTGDGAGDWTLVDIDLAERSDQRLGAARVDAWTRWRNTNTGDEARLDVTVHRGWDTIQVARVPDSDSPVPTGLESLLSPVASDRLLHPQPVRQVRAREAIN